MNNEKQNDWDRIFFALLEGELPEEEKEKLLAEIQEDPGLIKEWELWQKTVYEPELDVDAALISSLKKDAKANRIPWMVLSVAASLVVLLGLSYIFLPNLFSQDEIIVESTHTPSVVDSIATQSKDPLPFVHNDSTEALKSIEKRTPHWVDVSGLDTTKSSEDSSKSALAHTPFEEIIADLDTAPKIDTALVNQLKEVIAEARKEGPRARGNDIVVTIESTDSSHQMAKQVDSKLRKILQNYRMAGSRKQYELIKEDCLDKAYCYTLRIIDHQNKTLIVL